MSITEDTRREGHEAIDKAKRQAMILGCLHGRQMTARQIADALTQENISLSAVYRNLSDLEADGLLKRSVREGTRDVFYQYIAAEECKDSLHLSCRVCGKSIHLGDAEAERLLDSTLKSTGFQIDKTETILYGVCADCRKHRK